jgi:hypothetical protein
VAGLLLGHQDAARQLPNLWGQAGGSCCELTQPVLTPEQTRGRGGT